MRLPASEPAGHGPRFSPVVFGVRPSLVRQVAYAGWLLFTFGCGLAAVQAAARADLAPVLLAALPILITAPLGFLGGRLLLASGHDPERQEAV